jgi:hypothetical protein
MWAIWNRPCNRGRPDKLQLNSEFEQPRPFRLHYRKRCLIECSGKTYNGDRGLYQAPEADSDTICGHQLWHRDAAVDVPQRRLCALQGTAPRGLTAL